MAGPSDPTVALLSLRQAADHAHRLALYRNAVDDDTGRGMLALLDALTGDADRNTVGARYARVFTLLAGEAELSPGPIIGDAWQNHLLDHLLDSVNPFSLKAELVAFSAIGHSLVAQAAHDLRILQQLFAADAQAICVAMATTTGDDAWVPWTGFRPLLQGATVSNRARLRLKQAFTSVSDWGAMAELLAEYYRSAGTGDFGRFRAFRWVRMGEDGRLAGVAAPDPVCLDDLTGYEEEREPVVRNTVQFVAGHPANNVLLYGEQGTGKSSTVKALLNAFGDRGLRLVEVAKEDLTDFPRILALLRGRPERFILFVDDLSFEDQETNYKALKAILEGGIEARPDNVLLYATSNRRHLVKERFADRSAPGDDEIHLQDSMEEKLSLAARFGMRVTFMAPGQERFFAIVESLARSRGLDIPPQELRRRATAWAQWQNGRSGRTARQFIDHLSGELALGAGES